MQLKTRILEENAGTVVVLSGEIDFSEIDGLRTGLEEVCNTAEGLILLEMSGVSFIASDGLGVLINTRALAEQRGQKLSLVAVRPEILEILHKTHLTKLFSIYVTLEEAAAAL